MLILYCEKCGKRIPQAMLDAMGVAVAEPERQYYCTDCASTAPPAPVSARGSGTHAATAPLSGRPPSGGVRVMKPPSEFAQAVRPPTAMRAKRVTESAMRRQQTPGGEFQARPSSMKWAALVAGGVFLLAAAVILMFSGGKKPETAVAQENPKPAEHKESREVKEDKPNVPQPTPPAPINREPVKHAETPGPGATPTPAANAQAHELSPKEQYEQRLKEGKIKPAAPPLQTAPPVSDASLMEMTDPAALREKLTALGQGAPHDAIKHLGELPPPAIAETVIYKSDFQKNDTHGWASDYSAKVTAGTFEGENGFKVENGEDRVACYKGFDFATNHTHLKFRIFQKGLNRMQISIASVFMGRFNTALPLPPEGKWTDISIDASKLTSDGVKFENIPVKHLEIHGFRTAQNNGAYFIVSKVEIVNGGK